MQVSRFCISLFLSASSLLLLTNCGNPADTVAEGLVGEAVPMAGDAGTSPGDLARTYTFGAGPNVTTPSTLAFVGSKVTGSHDGGFNEFSGTIELTGGTPEGSSMRVEIPIASLFTDNPKLTGHLQTAEFLDAEQYPTATLVSTAIVPTADGYSITGNLDLHGVTKSVTFPAQIAVTETGITAGAEFFIKRFDWDIVYKGRADDLIRDEVVLKLNIVATPT